MKLIKSVIHHFYLSETTDSIGFSASITWSYQRKVVPLYQRDQPPATDWQPDRKASLTETE